MTVRLKVMDNELFFSSAASFVDTGHYRKCINDYPDFLKEDDSHRKPSANICKMIVASTWQGEQIGEITPQGNTYFVFTYQDHIHEGGDPHFNKTVQMYTHDNAGRPIRFTLEKGVDDHYITAAVAGTALSYLEQAYKIPANNCGPISDLLAEGTSLDPYSTD